MITRAEKLTPVPLGVDALEWRTDVPCRQDAAVLGIPAFTGDVPWFLPGLTLTVIIGFLARRKVAEVLGVSPAHAWAAVVSIGLILSATLTPFHLAAGVDGSRIAGCDFSRVGFASLHEILKFDDPTLNILLFIPLGVVIAFVPGARRKSLFLAAAIALPVVIETIQLVATPLQRACQSADVFDNATGLIIGFALGAIAKATLDAFWRRHRRFSVH